MSANGHITDEMAAAAGPPEDFRQARRNGDSRLEACPTADRLPPHSEEAERGVLGCILLSPGECLAQCERERVEPEWFYLLANRGIYRAVANMRAEALADPSSRSRVFSSSSLENEKTRRREDGRDCGIDIVTVQQRLRDHGHLEEVGGVAYLAALPDSVPSAANLSYYLDILREKWVLRGLVAHCSDAIGRAYEGGGRVELLVESVRGRFDELALAQVNPAETSTLLRPANDFGEGVFNRWFHTGEKIEEPGWKLPPDAFGEFPFKIRTKEQSLVLGEKGKGKTTMLSYIALHLMGQGAKVVLASMEMAPDETLEVLVRQLLGTAPNAFTQTPALPNTPEGHRAFQEALLWLRQRCEILDFRGIIQYRQLLDEFKRAVDRGFNVFIVDNIMKIGLMEDDMAGHGMAANEFHAFAVGSNAHVFMVNHLNKSEGHSRHRSRGSARWPDASNNVFTIDRNEKKWDKLAEFKRRLEEKILLKPEYDEETAELRLEWDGKFILSNQRLQASVQNASRAMWFVFAGSQYQRVDGNVKNVPLLYERLVATNWLEKWRGREDGKTGRREDEA